MARLQDDPKAPVERFHPTSGRVTGWMTVVMAAAVVVAGLAYLDAGFPRWVIGAALLVGVAAWAAMLRPALWVTGEHLVMRNLAETVHIRLAAVEELAVRQVLAVRAADRRWVSTVIGRSWRKAIRTRPTSGGATPQDGMPYADFVETRLHDLVDDARTAAGVRPGSTEQLALPDAVRREPAWVPLGLMAASAVVLLVTLLL
ncbi:hypothetical protein SAMN05192575_10892 [Nocardioides alpinus]|uniref:Uncharacterized protein n=1 Tax=Nocardioides alpinus TaxID=748909 RepID=A0A1I1AAZ9_9ACTN|nr:hypothetical protein [Nocardioides alpinus]PKH43467.1 hypothetical protein CXG46_03110 [Nocardioides alpinus]SFB35134.1 hypothetical protein SAMN05192575_10892 [Nocardioides alpinus]